MIPNSSFKHIDYLWLLVLILTSVFLKLCVIGNNISDKITFTNTLDFSWQSDIVQRFLHGFIAGKDFIFTYGPLYQFLASIPSLIFKVPSYTSILYAQILFTIIVCVLIFFIVKLITSNKKEIIILSGFLLFIIDLNSYPFTSDLIRILFPLFYALLYTKHAPIKNPFSLKVLSILLLPTTFGLYTFDLFILGVLITGIFIVYEFILLRYYSDKKRAGESKKYFFNGIIQLSIIGLFETGVSLLLSKNLNYLLYSLDTIKNYQFVMNIPWSFNRSIILLIFPISLLGMYFYAKKTLNNKTSLLSTFTILLITALLELKSAFIRSDEGHIIMGIYPGIIVLFIMSYFIFQNKGTRLIIFSLFILLYIMIPFRASYYSNISAGNLKIALSTILQKKSFFEIYKLTDTSYFDSNDFNYFRSLISNNQENVMVYPYDTYILNIYGQTYNTLPLQFYPYSNSLVEEKTVEKLKKHPPQFIILGIDKKSTLDLDNIPNFSRNPLIAKWMLENYIVYKNMGKKLILKHLPNKSTFNNGVNCQVYDIKNSQSIKFSLFNKLIKPATYYFGENYEIRLPYSPNTKEMFMVNGYDNPIILEKLFSKKINFEKFKIRKSEDIMIIKKSPLSRKKEILRKEDFLLKCY